MAYPKSRCLEAEVIKRKFDERLSRVYIRKAIMGQIRKKEEVIDMDLSKKDLTIKKAFNDAKCK